MKSKVRTLVENKHKNSILVETIFPDNNLSVNTKNKINNSDLVITCSNDKSIRVTDFIKNEEKLIIDFAHHEAILRIKFRF